MELTKQKIDLIEKAIDTRIQCWILLNLEKSEVQELKDLRVELMFEKLKIDKK